MKKSIKGAFCKFGLMLFLAMYSIAGRAQLVPGGQYVVSITAASATSNTIDFSLSVTALTPDTATGMRFFAYSAGINFNTAIINGGAISAAYVGGRSAEFSQLPMNTINLATPGIIRLLTASYSSGGGVDMARGTTLSLGTYRITNTVNWSTGNASLWLQNILFTGKTNTTVNGYAYGGTGAQDSYITTKESAAGVPSLVLSHTQAAPYGLTVGQTCATSGLASVTNAACFGGTGSATITMSPVPTVKAITYTGAGSGSATLTAGGAFTISGLAAGTYSVVVSNAGCGDVTVPVTVTAPALQTSSTTIAACGSYTWAAGNGVSYTASGNYTYTDNTGACPVERTLHLTITPATSHSTTISVCGPYHWGVNDADYTESGTYTSVRDCHTEILVLTITTPSNHTTAVSECGSYTWANNGQTYTASGTYYGTTTNCVTEVLNLTITPVSTHSTTVVTCADYTWSENGQTYTVSGTYNKETGCHTEVLQLTIENGITVQPVSTYICGAVGSTATYTVGVDAPSATYTWQYRVPTATNASPAWITITSANAAVYSNYNTAALTVTRTATLPAKGTQYRVLVSGSDCGPLTSDVATITILTAVKAGSITVPATSVCLGNDLTMTLSGYAGTSFQWESSPLSSSTVSGVFTPIDGATGPTYTLTNAQLNANRSYHVIVTNACDNTTATSATKTITVNPTSVAGSIILGGGTVCEGASGSMKVAGYVGKIQWQYSTDGVNYTNAPKALDGQLSPFGTTSTNSTGASYLVNNISINLYFRVKVTSGACSSVYTTPVQYVIGGAPIVGVASSASSQLCAGTGTTLNLTNATGVISWKKTTNGGLTWSTIANSNALSISTGNLTSTTTFMASVTIGGICGVAESNFVVVNVDKASKGGTVSPVKVGTEACSGVAKQLKVASNLGSIQWQSSADGVNYTDIGGATAALYDAVITAPTWFRVEATSGVCSSAYSNAIQLTLSAPAVAGTLSGAADTVCASSGTTITLGGTTNGILVWQKSTNWNATTPTWSAISATLIINNQFSTGNLTASTAYRVMATNNACVDYSNVYVVAVTAKPVAKSITANTTSPLGTAATSALCTDNSVEKVLTIGLGSVGAIQWETVVSATTPTALTVWTPIQNANGTSYTITNPSAGVNYFRAKFSNGVCADVYSAAFKVYYKDCAPPAKASTALPFAVVAYPNPYSDNFHLNLTTSSEERVGVSIYDMTGKLLDKMEVGATEASELSIGDRFASGVYNVVVTQGSEVKTLRVVKR